MSDAQGWGGSSVGISTRERNAAFCLLGGVWKFEFWNFALLKLRKENKQGVLACAALDDVYWTCFQRKTSVKKTLRTMSERHAHSLLSVSLRLVSIEISWLLWEYLLLWEQLKMFVLFLAITITSKLHNIILSSCRTNKKMAHGLRGGGVALWFWQNLSNTCFGLHVICPNPSGAEMSQCGAAGEWNLGNNTLPSKLIKAGLGRLSYFFW